MSTFLLTRSLGLRLTLGATATTYALSQPFILPRQFCQAVTTSSSQSWLSQQIPHNENPTRVQYEESSSIPVFNPVAFRQISSGSFIGLLAGIAIGKVSRLLAVVSLVLVFGIQFLDSKGIHLVPYSTLQRWIGETDARKMMTENLPFKAAFGSTFLLAAFYPSR